jgi:hypothetical protein
VYKRQWKNSWDLPSTNPVWGFGHPQNDGKNSADLTHPFSGSQRLEMTGSSQHLGICSKHQWPHALDAPKMIIEHQATFYI